MSAPHRIKATIRSDGSALVTLPTGEAARVWRDELRPHEWRWDIVGTDDSDTWGSAMSQQGAYRAACWASARRKMKPATVAGFNACQALELERSDRSTFTRALKSLLVRSTGHRGFRVYGSKGTAYSWVKVKGTDERGELWCAAIFGDADHSIPPTRGYRATAIALAAGIDPSPINCADHAWD